MSDQMFVATRKGLFRIDRSGSGWKIAQAAFLGDSVTMVLPDQRDGSVYAAVGHGHFGAKMHRSTDNGATFEEIATPVYPERPDNVEPIRHPYKDMEIPWSLELIWALESGGADETGVLWCGTLPGGLFRSSDHGASWELNESLWSEPTRKEWFGGGYDYPGIHSIGVDPRDTNHVTVGISCGGSWQTNDGGDTWVCRSDGMYADYMPPEMRDVGHIQDPHRTVHCPAEPDHLWTQHHNGVFKSVDGGRTWTDVNAIKPSNFGFAVAVHPVDPNIAWFVPAVKDEHRIPVDGKVVVARTRDGGTTFDVLTDGLPQSHAYDLTFRHALDVDETGSRLAFGSTTGSLWCSSNQGDSWETISANLPPIHAVRFVSG